MCILLTFTSTQKVVEAAMLGNICNSIGLDTPNIPTSTITFICSDVDGFNLASLTTDNHSTLLHVVIGAPLLILD